MGRIRIGIGPSTSGNRSLDLVHHEIEKASLGFPLSLQRIELLFDAVLGRLAFQACYACVFAFSTGDNGGSRRSADAGVSRISPANPPDDVITPIRRLP